jgi:hypothetical protein
LARFFPPLYTHARAFTPRRHMSEPAIYSLFLLFREEGEKKREREKESKMKKKKNRPT